MSSRPRNYVKLSRTQIDILERKYNEGMKSTTCCHGIIERAAEEAAISVEKVKKWIGNKNQSKRRKNAEEPSEDLSIPPKMPKPPSSIRGSTGYNLFCSDFFQSEAVQGISTLGEKNKLASAKWKSLMKEEQQEWVEKATAQKQSLPFQLDASIKDKLIDQHIKLIAKELSYLESLGCQSSCLLLKDRDIFVLGSSEGKSLVHGDPSIVCKFQSFFDVDEKVQYTHEDVRQLFNKKYSEARGAVGLRVPYMAGGFRVEGLPENVIFKKPRHYRSAEIMKLMDQKDDIKFVIEKEDEKMMQSSETLNTAAGNTSNVGNHHEVVLEKEPKSSSQSEAAQKVNVVDSSTTSHDTQVGKLADADSAQSTRSIVGVKRDQDIVALGFRCPNRKSLHGADIPIGYECILIKWVNSNDIRSVLVLGDPEENMYLSAGQFFALPTDSLVQIVYK